MRVLRFCMERRGERFEEDIRVSECGMLVLMPNGDGEKRWFEMCLCAQPCGVDDVGVMRKIEKPQTCKAAPDCEPL